jgi:glycosyltransferase involved in cell wall biosynthesis
MPRFSVVIPLYNKEGYVESTLKSVLEQTFTDFEIIVVNDCSTDASMSVVEKIQDSRIKILEHSMNKGLSASRNTGIKNAEASYIAFLDADDLWKPDFLKKIDFLITHYPEASLFATKYEVLLKNNKVISFNFKIDAFEDHGIIANFFDSSLNQSIFYPSCLCVDSKVFEDIGYYNENISFSEDVDFNIRSQSKFKLAYSDEALVTYLSDSENQITKNSLLGKTVPDYDYYEAQYKNRKDIKRYLDFQRYLKAKLFKLSRDYQSYHKLKDKIDLTNLTAKQRILLKLPRTLLQGISNIKLFLQKSGIEVNSY